MEQLCAHSQLAINPEVIAVQIDDEMIMMGVDNSEYYALNAVGVSIWSLLTKSPQSLQTLCTSVLEEYVVDEPQCVADLTVFVESMLEQKMLVVLTA